MKSVRWVLGASLAMIIGVGGGSLFLVACGSTEKAPKIAPADDPHAQHAWEKDPDSNMGFVQAPPKRGVAAEGDTRVSYAHDGAHNFNPGTAKGITIVDTTDKAGFKKALASPKFVASKAVSENYEYETNREDILARHTFVLAGADRKLGHHVAFFESRHQHHALVKLELDFTGATKVPGLAAGLPKAANLKAGKALFEAKILKEGTPGVPALPPGSYYAVQVSPKSPEFELVSLPTGVTASFLGSLATITSEGAVTRFVDEGDVVVKITGIHHFSRMYTGESPSALQYMAFSANEPGNLAKVVLTHLIMGTLQSAPEGFLNVEHMIEAEIVEPAGFAIKEGAILQFEDRPTYALLQPGDVVEGFYYPKGTSDRQTVGSTQKVKFKVGKVAYERPIGIDGGQKKIREKFRGVGN